MDFISMVHLLYISCRAARQWVEKSIIWKSQHTLQLKGKQGPALALVITTDRLLTLGQVTSLWAHRISQENQLRTAPVRQPPIRHPAQPHVAAADPGAVCLRVCRLSRPAMSRPSTGMSAISLYLSEPCDNVDGYLQVCNHLYFSMSPHLTLFSHLLY